MTLWLVPAATPGLRASPFDGLGLRGNASGPVSADGVCIPRQALLGADGAGLDLAVSEVLPVFLVLNAAASVGMMEAVTAETAGLLSRTRLVHVGRSLADQPYPSGWRGCAPNRPGPRPSRRHAAALEAGRAMRDSGARGQGRGGESAAERRYGAARCGGAAFRKESGIERRFRDAGQPA